MAVLTMQFISPKGGAGASLVSFELAQELALRKKKVLFAYLHGEDFWNFTQNSLLSPIESDSAYKIERSAKISSLHSVSISRVDSMNEAKAVAWLEGICKLAKERNYDYLILDLQSLFFSQWILKNDPNAKIILISNPDISAVQQTYNWMEVLIDFQLKAAGSEITADELISQYKASRAQHIAPFFHWLKDNHLEMALSLDRLFAFQGFHLIVNKIRVEQDKSLVYSIPSVVRKFFGLKVSPLGCIHYDQNVWQAFRTVNSDFFGLKLDELSIGITHIQRQLEAIQRGDQFDLVQDRAVG